VGIKLISVRAAKDVLTIAVTGLLARLAGILAEEKIAIFAISTFDTDYILIRGEAVAKAKSGFEDSDIKTEIVKI
jgi:hypothetical protein